ncbi:glycoside hydrolase family 5 protein [Dendrothele bispora CBS 962.96]|uniref:Glycoside hydrolase family 5 protein n=1 Tax=Dendrothele bispora (strain CBS 962.96) TaxID=1314807 RepID=A0A4S8MWB8_DENBC|nr:glycoside hydrolase family 5 protein [Dendrothele bispora CBS 962.96]
MFISFFFLVLLSFSPAEAKRQCHLRPKNNLVVTSLPSLPTPTSASVTGSSTTTSALPSRTPFSYGNNTIRGVNLGGWFVLEPWITPSIFENTDDDGIVDEFTLGQRTDFNASLEMLQNHWNTWITEDDFIAIAEAGLNHVRIPLGYWSVPMTSSDTNQSTSVDPYIPGAWPYLLRALNWAAAHNIHVIIDLHGAPGSQNGYDNSGQRTSNPQWAFSSQNISRTIDTMVFIAKEIGGMIDVLELMNEPAGFRSDTWASVTRQYFQDAYDAVRGAVGGGMRMMIGDAFLGVDDWDGFLTYPSGEGVIMDKHMYQIFSNLELSRSEDDHISFACNQIPDFVSYASSNIWTIIGEWSNAKTDCALWLNGRGTGARWDGSISPGSQSFGSCQGLTGDMSTFSDEYKTFLRRYWEVQTEIGERINGWIFWTWKAENADEWSYQRGLEGGWLPQDPTERLYPNICP